MEEKRCPVCRGEIKNRYNKFCSRGCASKYKYLDYISKWKQGLVDGGVGNWGEVSDNIRKYLHEKSDSKCFICGWGETNPYTNKVPLEIDHIDTNRCNNRKENLRWFTKLENALNNEITRNKIIYDLYAQTVIL